VVTAKLVVLGIVTWHVVDRLGLIAMDVLYSSVPLLHAARFGG
jgi:hypothetical protein